MSFRNRRLLDLAHHITECTIELPVVCRGYMPGGCVPSHSDRQIHGKGIAEKANDCFFAASCDRCNTALCDSKDFDRETKHTHWQRGFEKTLLMLWTNGWLRVTK